MGKPGMDMVVTGNRMDLGLAAEAAKRAGENDTVMILVERAAPELVAAMSGLAESFTGKQCVPVKTISILPLAGWCKATITVQPRIANIALCDPRAQAA